MAAALDEHGSQLRQVDGIGAVTAVRLIGRTGPVSRFATPHVFATYAGVAPIEVASGERTRHRPGATETRGSRPGLGVGAGDAEVARPQVSAVRRST